jgi:phosphoglycolate phosphatase-like HAD superfamily hydrolase
LFKLRVAGIEHISIPMATADDSPNRTAIVARAIELARRWNDVQAYDRIWYVGDGIWDVQASLELGLAFIGVAGETKAERLRTAGATLVVEHPADVPGLFSPRPVRQTV